MAPFLIIVCGDLGGKPGLSCCVRKCQVFSVLCSSEEWREGDCSGLLLWLAVVTLNSCWSVTACCVAAAAAQSPQSCLTLCNPRDSSPPGSPVPGILQARTLEWVAISFSNVWKWKMKVKSLSSVRLLATPWTAAYQASPSMGFSRLENWSGCHCLLQIWP